MSDWKSFKQQLYERVANLAEDLIDKSENAERDRWLYEQRVKGTGWDRLQRLLAVMAPRIGWNPIESREGVIRAVRAFCKKKMLAFPRRIPGRPARRKQ